MQKSLRSIAIAAALSLALLPTLSAEPTGGAPRPPRGSGTATAVVIAISTMAAMLGL